MKIGPDLKIWNYYIPSSLNQGWGKFVIDESGYFSCVSDYGNYAFQWPNAGGNTDFREFLCSLSADYLSGKLGNGERQFKASSTEAKIRQRILEIRRSNKPHDEFGFGLDKEQAREAYDDLENCSSEYEFTKFIEEHWTAFSDNSEILTYGESWDMKNFCEKLYPLFVQELKKEMAAELPTCDHSERQEPEHNCNINHQGQAHRLCRECTDFCGHEPDDCPHIFAVQVCDCGKQFIGALGKKYDCYELVEHKEP